MLTTKQIAAIRRLHWIDKWPIRQIEEHLRVSSKTIGKYIAGPTPHYIRRSRPGKLDPYKHTLAALLQQDASLKSRLMLRQIQPLGYQGGISILRDYVRTIRTRPSGSPVSGSRQEAFEWMRALLQGAIPRSKIDSELKHVSELDKLLVGVTEGRLTIRNKAIAILARERGIGQSYVCSFLFLAKKTATRYWNNYQRGGTLALFARKPSGRQKSTDSRIQEAVFTVLHSPLPLMGSIERPGDSTICSSFCEDKARVSART